MAITCENSCGDDDDDALYAATEMLEARTGLDFLVSALSHEKEKPGPVASVANTGEASGLCRGDNRPQPAHTAKPAVPSAAGPSVCLPSRASSSKPPPRYKQAVLRWADPTDPGRPLADAGESVNHVTPTPSNFKKPSLTTLIYEEALETFKSTWSTDYPWLILIKNTAGMPAFKCRLCIDFAGDGGKCGKSGHGATDLQTQAFKRHAATNKHQLAINHQKQMLAQAGKQPRIDEHTLAKDDETTRVISLLNSLHFTTQNHLPMETWVRLVRYMAQNECTAMAEALVHNLDERLGSLDKLSGVKLFMPDEWPHGRQERSMPDWAEVVKIWRAYKKRKPITTVAAPKKQPSAKGKEKVDEDDAGGAGSGWGTETPVHRHGSMSDGGGSDEDEDMCVM
ncbi:unnamed protein product [Closterium sp. Naga37s-1]|nr:unnamed protein product [Closterium sp. Naga37s-1]